MKKFIFILSILSTFISASTYSTIQLKTEIVNNSQFNVSLNKITMTAKHQPKTERSWKEQNVEVNLQKKVLSPGESISTTVAFQKAENNIFMDNIAIHAHGHRYNAKTIVREIWRKSRINSLL